MPGVIDAGSTVHARPPSAEQSSLFSAPLGQLPLSLSGPLIVLCIVTVFVPLIDGGTTHLPVMIIRLILLSACSVWIFQSLRSGIVTCYRTPVFWLIGMFIGLSGLSLLWTPYLNVGIQQFVSLLFYSAFFSIVLHAVNCIGHVRALVMILLGMGLFEGMLGIIQYIWLGEARARGTFFNPNCFAAYESASLMLALALIMFSWSQGTHLKEKLFLACTALTTFCGFLLAQSRGALLAFCVAVTVVGVYRYGRFGLIFLLVLVLGGTVLPNPMKQRLQTVSTYDPYAYTRVDIWRNSLRRVGDNPWGVGLGMYKYSSFQNRFPIDTAIARYGKRAESAHNEYLQIAVELGLGGVFLFLLGMGTWGWEARKTLQGVLPQWDRGVVVGLCGGIFVMSVHATVDSVFHEPALVLLLVLSGGLVLVLKRLNESTLALTWNIPFLYHPARFAVALTLIVSMAFLSIQPAAAWFAFEQGNKASQGGDNVRAREWYERAVLIDPGTTAYHDAIALTKVQEFRKTGDPHWLILAIEDIKVGITLNSLDGRLPYRLGTMYLFLAQQASSDDQRIGFVDLAADSYEKAITLDPYSPFNYLALGKIRWQQGDVKEARALFAQAVQYEPNFLPAQVGLIKIAMDEGQMEDVRSRAATIREIQERYRGRVLTPLEKEYIDVSLESLEQALVE